jgi:hypothetical protein
MKKIIALLFAIVAFCGAQAESNESKAIWGKGRYTNIGYTFSQTAAENQPIDKSQFSGFIRKGASYLFPGHALGNVVKIGFDINWFEVSTSKYKSTDVISSNWDDEAFEDGESELLNIGRWNIMLGAFGIGPNVTVAPFASLNNGARFLKASIYFHYQPTMGAYLVSESGETDISYAYCHMWQFGGKITWKNFGIGIEGYWGKGKFNRLALDEDEDENISFNTSDKVNRKFANTRLYLNFSF